MATLHWRVRLGRLRQQFTMQLLGVVPPSSFRFLPLDSRTFGPARRWSTVASYLRGHPEVRWHRVFPSAKCTFPRANAPRELAERLWFDGWPELGVAVLLNARVLDAAGLPIAERDTLLVDFATGLDRPEYTSFLTKRCRVDPEFNGRALNLGTVYGQDNYCHFLLESLPRLELFFRAGFSFDDVDHILVPDFPGSTRDRFFQVLGLPREKIVFLRAGTQYQFRELIQPSFPGRETFVAPWVAPFFRDRVLKPSGISQERRRRLYVARSQRGLFNDAEIWALLEARGFTRVEPSNWDENVSLFASADIVVGPHGAGLSNVVFCPPGGDLVEFVPGDRAFPFFYSCACSAGMKYHGIQVAPLAPRGLEYRKLPSDEPYPINPDILLQILDPLLATRTV